MIGCLCLVPHLPRTPCDKFLYDIPCDFLGIVGGYGLRHLRFTSTGIVRISSMGPRGQPGEIPYRDWAEIVRKSCNVSAVAVQSPHPPHGNRTESRAGDRPFARWPRAGIVQCHLRHVYGLRAYNFFKFVKLLAKPKRRGRGARESVRKSHSRLLPPQGGLVEAAQKGEYGQDTGSVDPSQAKCELGINDKPDRCAHIIVERKDWWMDQWIETDRLLLITRNLDCTTCRLIIVWRTMISFGEK